MDIASAEIVETVVASSGVAVDWQLVDYNNYADSVGPMLTTGAMDADIILLPAPGTVPGITMEYVKGLIAYAHSRGVLTITAIGTSQEGADADTIKRIALMCKMAGTDIHHIGDTGYPGMALPENIMAYSVAVRGVRHTYHRMAVSINR